MANPNLDLVASPRRKVFREIVRTLRADATLARVVARWDVWDGDESTRADAPRDADVAFELRPKQGPLEWHTPDSHLGRLVVQITIEVTGTDADDVMDLWWAVERAFYPQDDNAAIQAIRVALQAAGSETGLVTFNQPAESSDPTGDGNRARWRAVGELSIDVIEVINP